MRWGWYRTLVGVAVAFAIGLLGSGCGNSTHDAILTVASGKAPEEVILGQIYAQALEAAGYGVERRLAINGAVVQDELRVGRVSGYPEHLNDALTYLVGILPSEVPADPMNAYEKAKAALKKDAMTVFPPAPFQFAEAVGMLRKTAETRGLQTASDLKGQSEEMTLKGPLGCHSSSDCLGGLEAYYGVGFKSFSEATLPQRYKVLEDGQTDASMLPTTDGRLAAEKNRFVILEEDKHRFPAGNVVWMTTPQVVEEAGPDYEKAIVEAQKGLTQQVMQELNAKVELEKQPAVEVAAEYLAQQAQ